MASAASRLPRRLPRVRNRIAIDQRRPFGQVDADGGQHPFDEVGAVVVVLDLDALGELLPDLVQLDLDVPDHLAGILADQHHHGAGDDLPLAVHGDDAVAERRTDPDVRHPAQQRRGAVVVDGQHGVGDVLGVLELGLAADDDLLAVALDVAAAHVGVVLLEGGQHLAQRQLEPRHLPRVEHHLVLLDLAPHRVDLDDAGDGAQPVGDDPVEQRAQLHGPVAIRLQIELVDLAEAGRDGRQLGAAVAGRDVGLGELEPLGDELAREPDVAVVAEHQGHRRQAGLADRTDLAQAGDAVHRGLDRIGEVLLDLGGGESGRGGQDGDLDVGDVGDRVDRQARHGHERRRRHEAAERQNQRALLDGYLDQSLEHLHGRSTIATVRGGAPYINIKIP